jgi:hypothetical protein
MKAKEYAKIAKDGNYDLEAVSKVVQGLLGEISSITKIRNVSTMDGMNRVVQEIRQKWTAICRRTEGLHEDGFDKFLMEKGLINKDCKLDADFLRGHVRSIYGEDIL